MQQNAAQLGCSGASTYSDAVEHRFVPVQGSATRQACSKVLLDSITAGRFQTGIQWNVTQLGCSGALLDADWQGSVARSRYSDLDMQRSSALLGCSGAPLDSDDSDSA